MQTQRNDGGWYRSLVDLTWADAWEASGREFGAPVIDHGLIDELIALEVEWWALEPEAREAAMATMGNDPVDWDQVPADYRELVQTAREWRS